MMAAVVLVGVVAFRQLPVSALPQVDYPTIQIQTFYPGASPQVIATAVTAPLERQFGQVPGLTQMTSISSSGVRWSPCSSTVAQYRYCRAGGAGGHQLVGNLPAEGPAVASHLQQDQSRGHADSNAGSDVRNAAHAASGRTGRNQARAEDLTVSRRGPGEHQRRTASGVRIQANPTALASTA